jgi:O-antigen/teichoic acid export membrane protein
MLYSSHMSIVGNVAKNTIAQGISRIGSLLISVFGVTPLLAHHLTKAEFGDYMFLSALVLLFGTTSDWGTNVISIREATQNPQKQPIIFGSSTLFRLILSFLSVISVNVLVFLVPSWNVYSQPVAIASLLLLALSVKTSMSVIFNSLFRLDLAALVDFLSSLFFFLFLLFAVLLNLDLLNTMWAWVIATFTVSLIAFFLAYPLSPIIFKIDWKIIRRIFWEAAPTGTLLLVFSLYNRLDIVILQYFNGSESVGAYGLAYKMHENIVLAAAFLMTALFPHLSAVFKVSKEETRNYYQKAFDLLFVFSIIQLIAVFILAPFIVSFLGSGKFPEASDLWKILSVATFFAYFNHLTGYSLIAFGKQKASLLIAIIALVFNLVANFVLIPYFSSTAAAYITIATEAMVLVLSSIVVKKTIGNFPSLFSFPQTLKYLVGEYKN